MKKIVLSILMFTACVPILAQSSDIPITIKQLRQIKTDCPDADIPTAARPLLTQLKQQLFILLSETIQSPKNQQKSPVQLQTITLKKLAELGVKTGESPNEKPDEYRYGDIYDIKVKRGGENLNLLAATITIGVCCGQDTSLYIFKRIRSRWQLALRQEANDYKDVSGAQGIFHYAISKLDSKQNFFVVTARVTPWCTSAWQGLYYQVLRPSLRPEFPKILLAQKEIIYLGNDLIYKLRLTSNTFSLRFETKATNQQFESGILSRLRTLKYVVIRNDVKKIFSSRRK